MPTLVPVPVQLHVNAVLEFYAALRVGDHERPKDRTLPYGILHAVDDAPPPDQPPLTITPTDLWIGIQITSVGSSRKQAQWHADNVRDRLLSSDSVTGAFLHNLPAIAGWRWNARIGSTPSGVAPEGSALNVLYNAPNRYTLHVTPA